MIWEGRIVHGYFFWWYGQGLSQSWQITTTTLGRIADFFSLEILVRTWFAPWKNDVITARNIALSDQVKIWQQNFASRLVGFFLRTFMIVFCLILIGLSAFMLSAALFVWLILPFLIILLPIIGVRMLFS